MPTKVHFISGLPRSGSTLLCALLRQNPRFHTAVTSPLAGLCATILNKMSPATEFSVFYDDARRRRMLHGLFDSYYGESPREAVFFDTNRTWTRRVALLKTLYPECRVICCVRDIGWILDSIEAMLRKNPLQTSRLFKYTGGGSVYTRAESLMNADSGLVGSAWSALREAWFGADADRLVLLEYDRLAKQPEQSLDRLYRVLGEPPFRHDFDNVVYDEPDYDFLLGMPGMHRVDREVRFRRRDPCIPPDLHEKYSDWRFWAKPGLNPRGILVV